MTKQAAVSRPRAWRPRNGCLRIGLLLGLLLGAASAQAHTPKSNAGHSPVLGIASFGGVQDAQQSALFGPYSATSGVRLQVQTWDLALATLQNRAQTGRDDWDLALIEAVTGQLACREGMLLPHPLTADPANTAPDSDGTNCGVAAWRMNLVLAWDKSRLDTAPGWGDFWDVAQHPGKRGLRRDPRGTLEIALMADGVAPADVYHTLSSTEGVDRAFRKLDQLKPYIVWWNTPGEAVQIIESGAVLMTSAPDGEVATADQAGHRNFGMQQSQSLGIAVDWVEPRPTSMERRAPERAAMTRSLLGFLSDPQHRAAFLAAYPALSATPTLIMDNGFWLDHLVALQQRFEHWAEAK